MKTITFTDEEYEALVSAVSYCLADPKRWEEAQDESDCDILRVHLLDVETKLYQ